MLRFLLNNEDVPERSERQGDLQLMEGNFVVA